MIIQYVGKIRRSGVSKKTGNNYDFVELHFIKENTSFDGGRCTSTKTIFDPDTCKGLRDMISMQHYNADFDDNGNIIALSPVKV